MVQQLSQYFGNIRKVFVSLMKFTELIIAFFSLLKLKQLSKIKVLSSLNYLQQLEDYKQTEITESSGQSWAISIFTSLVNILSVSKRQSLTSIGLTPTLPRYTKC